MESEYKLFIILVAFLVGLPLLGLAYKDHTIGQCKIVAIQANMPVDQIEKICK